MAQGDEGARGARVERGAVRTGRCAAGLALLWFWALRADPSDPPAFTRFYMRVWALFFMEYLIVPAAVLSS